MSDQPAARRAYHRPTLRPTEVLEQMGERSDPFAEVEAAHETAAVLLHTGRAATDPEVTERLVHLVDDLGLSTLADLWATRPAHSLPGALWRLYVLREWIRTNPVGVAREYATGVPLAESHHVVAGAEPPGPDEILRMADAILRGAFTGDFAVALERAAAFCRVVVAGRAVMPEASMPRALQLRDVADDLAVCASMWRAGTLH